MKILILSTFASTGGAAIAANRLMRALNANGAEATMLCRRNVRLPLWKEKWGGVPFLLERLKIWLANGMSGRNLFAVDIACCGDDVTSTKAFKDADVIHLHWVNQGFISIRTLQRIVNSGKRIIWTMHDQWPMTGICHYSEECTRYEKGCGHCPLLKDCGADDLSRSVFHRKQRIYSGGRITFVTCSEWLGRMARASMLARGQKVVAIPNPIDTAVFHHIPRNEARTMTGLPAQGTLILFGCQKVTDKRKGLDYLISALGELDSITVVLVGGNAEATRALMPQGVHTVCAGQVSSADTMAALYAAADAFVTPSLQDNLPNTIMEAMACGVPCVGFKVGGIPEMIDHQTNGYVAAYRDAADLARGMRWVLSEADADGLRREALAKVSRSYSQQSVAMKYIEVYNHALARKHYRI